MKFTKLVKSADAIEECYAIVKKSIQLQDALNSLNEKITEATDKRPYLDPKLSSKLAKDLEELQSVLDNTLATVRYFDGQLLNYLD